MRLFFTVTALNLLGTLTSVVAAPVSVRDLISNSEEDHHAGITQPNPSIALRRGNEHLLPTLRRRAGDWQPPMRRPSHLYYPSDHPAAPPPIYRPAAPAFVPPPPPIPNYIYAPPRPHVPANPIYAPADPPARRPSHPSHPDNPAFHPAQPYNPHPQDPGFYPPGVHVPAGPPVRRPTQPSRSDSNSAQRPALNLPQSVTSPGFWPRVIAREMETDIGCPKPKSLPLDQFIAYIAYRTHYDDQTMAGGLYLVAEWTWQNHQKLGSSKCTDAHQLFIAAVMVASKALHDDTYSNKSWLTIAQAVLPNTTPWLNIGALNKFERDFFATVEHKVTLQFGDVLEDFMGKIRDGVPAVPALNQAVTKYLDDKHGQEE